MKKSLTSINRIVILDVYVIKELSLSRNGSICTRCFWLLITFLFIKSGWLDSTSLPTRAHDEFNEPNLSKMYRQLSSSQR